VSYVVEKIVDGFAQIAGVPNASKRNEEADLVIALYIKEQRWQRSWNKTSLFHSFIHTFPRTPLSCPSPNADRVKVLLSKCFLGRK
jgi:hypothetical protein